MRRYCIRIITLAVALAVLCPPFQSSALNGKQLTIGVLTVRPEPETQATFQPVADYLAKALHGHTVELKLFNHDELENAIKNQELDFVITNPGHYIQIRQKNSLSGALATIVQQEGPTPVSAHGGVIFTCSDRKDIRNLDDLKDKTIAIVAMGAFAGYQVQAYELFKIGIKLPTDAKLISTGLPQDLVVQAVLEGKADIGFVRTGLIEQMASEGRLDLRKLKIINRQDIPSFPFALSTRLYPGWPFVALPHVDDFLSGQVAAALLSMKHTNAKRSFIYGFAIPADYSPVESLLRELRLPPFDATPVITSADIWKRYRFELIAVGVFSMVLLFMLVVLIAVNRKLTMARRLAEEGKQALEQVVTEWSTAMDASEDIIYLLDIERHLIRANKAFYKATGRTPETAIGSHVAEILHPDKTHDLCPVCHAQDDKQDTVIIMEKDHICNPLERPLETTIRIIRDNQGQPVSILTMIHDLSNDRKVQEEKARLEMQLSQSHKMEAIGQLAGGIAHDFNNILTAIIGYGTMALMRLKDDTRAQEFINQMLSGANRAAELTHGLLAFSRKQVISPRPHNLNDIVVNIEKMLRRIIGEDIDFRIALGSGDIMVMVDSAQIDQVLLNLATNARDAMPDGGNLIIETAVMAIDGNYAETHLFENTGPYAVLTVSDTGIGMDKKTRDNIFEPFFTTKGVGKGTGLGLAMVYGIVKQHGGNINVYSEPGKGTTFRIYLPVVTRTADEKGPKIIQPPPLGKGETILIAEDDSDIREMIRMYLQEHGYKIFEAADGQEAVKRFLENRDSIALLLLDVIMPVKNGKDTYEEIKVLRPDIKALFMSGYTDEIIAKKGILDYGFEFIAKPIYPDALLRKVREILDR